MQEWYRGQCLRCGSVAYTLLELLTNKVERLVVRKQLLYLYTQCCSHFTQHRDKRESVYVSEAYKFLGQVENFSHQRKGGEKLRS